MMTNMYDIMIFNYDWNGGQQMHANDYMNMDSARSQAIQQLAEVCAAMGLSWSATEKQFTIELPTVIVAKAVTSMTVPLLPTTRKTFDISTWGPVGPIEGLPDNLQLPDYGEMLDEGIPPQGDPNSES